ncbi:MAG: hypothetical protein RMN25_08710 [Anaerolineae bacterium]|nr:ribosome-recycling factor [Thermoflexales bacterium]MDW8407854.1 hypothetical protein [Anaerolineae bacterium]
MMQEKGGAGCAIVALIGVCAGSAVLVYWLATQAVWVLLAAPALLVVLLALADILRDDAYLAADKPGGLTAWHAATLTRLRSWIGKPAIHVVPQLGVSTEERLLVKRAVKLAEEVRVALRQRTVPETQRALLVEQAEAVPANIAAALWRLARLRRIKRAADPKTDQGRETVQQIDGLESQLLSGIRRSLDLLAAMPASMMQIELSRDARQLEQLSSDLNETNSKLRDLSSAYQELSSGSTV